MTVVGSAEVVIRANGAAFPASVRGAVAPGLAAAEAETKASGTRAAEGYAAGWKPGASGAAAAVESSGGRIRNDVKASESAFSRFGSASANAVSGVGKNFGVASSGIGSFKTLSVLGLAAAGGAAVKMAGDFEESTTQLVTGAGESTKNLDMVRKGLLTMAGQVGVSASDLSKGMYQIESAGFHGAAGLNILKIAAEGAKVGNADMATVADVLTSALNAYHLPASKATSVTNDLVATVARGKTHMQDLAASLGQILPIAASLHIPLSQVTGAMATMTVQGTSAGKAATSLRFLLSSLVNPTSKASSTMQDLGLSAKQVGDTLTHHGLQAALTEITDAAGKKFPVGSAQYVAAVAKMVGGTRGMTAALELSGTHAAVFTKNTAAIGKSAGDTSGKVHGWALVQKDFNTQLDIAKAKAGAMGIEIGTKLLPVFVQIVNDGQKAATWLGHIFGPAITSVLGVVNKLAGGQLGHIAEGLLAIGAAVTISRMTGLTRLVSVMGSFAGTAGGFSASLVRLATGSATAAETFPRVASGASKIGTAVIGARLGLLRLGAAFGGTELLGASLATGIGALVVGVGALGYVMFKNGLPVDQFINKVIRSNHAVGNNVSGYMAANKALNNYVKTNTAAGSAISHGYQAIGGATAAYEQQSHAVNVAGNAISQLTQKQRNVLKGANDTVSIFRGRLGPAFKITGEQAADLATRLHLDLSKGFDTVQRSGLTARQTMNNYVTSVKLSHNPQARLAADLQLVHDKTQSATAQTSAFSDALLTMSGKSVGAAQAANDFQQQMVSLRTSISSGSKTLNGNSAAAVQNRSAVLAAVQAAQQHAQAVFNQTGSLGKSKAALIADEKSLITNAQAVGLNHGQLVKMLQSLGATPAQAEKALAGVQKFARDSHTALKNLVIPKYNLQVMGTAKWTADQHIAPGGGLNKNAEGGPVTGYSPHPKADNIPMMATAGEWVQPVAAVQHYGTGAMEAVRQRKADIVPRYAEGGGVAAGGPMSVHADMKWAPPGIVKDTQNYLHQGEAFVAQQAWAALQAILAQGAGASTVLDYARRFIGTPYVWGGAEPGGFDCSGFTSFVLHHFGIGAPRTAAQQQQWASPESKRSALPGDLVFYGNPAHHVGFYLGGENYLDAPHTGTTIQVQSLYDSPTFGKEPGIARFQTMAGGAGNGVRGSAAANRAVGRSIAAAQGVDFNAMDYIAFHESGWDNTAQSPTSTAYGAFQFEDMTWPAYGGKTSDITRQTEDFIKYSNDRYGGVDQAEAYWRVHHNYDIGGWAASGLADAVKGTNGWLQPGLTAAVNGTGNREAVMPEDVMVDAIRRSNNPAELLKAVDEQTDYLASIRDLLANRSPGDDSYRGVTS